MIIGNGLIAKSFENYNLDCILFASGVSSSKEKSRDNFLREVNLLKETISNNPDKKIILEPVDEWMTCQATRM